MREAGLASHFKENLDSSPIQILSEPPRPALHKAQSTQPPMWWHQSCHGVIQRPSGLTNHAPRGLSTHSKLKGPWSKSPYSVPLSPRKVVSPLYSPTPSSLQASSPADESLAPNHLEFKFEPEDFAFTNPSLSPQPGLSGVLRQEAWCALALA